MRYFLILLLLISLSTFGVTVQCTLWWDAPTTLNDNTPLDPTLISEYRVFHSIDAQIDPDGTYTSVTGDETTVVSLDLQPKPTPYVLRFAVQAVLSDGRKSSTSMILTEDVLVSSTANPGPPTNLRLELNCSGPTCKIEIL